MFGRRSGYSRLKSAAELEERCAHIVDDADDKIAGCHAEALRLRKQHRPRDALLQMKLAQQHTRMREAAVSMQLGLVSSYYGSEMRSLASAVAGNVSRSSTRFSDETTDRMMDLLQNIGHSSDNAAEFVESLGALGGAACALGIDDDELMEQLDQMAVEEQKRVPAADRHASLRSFRAASAASYSDSGMSSASSVGASSGVMTVGVPAKI